MRFFAFENHTNLLEVSDAMKNFLLMFLTHSLSGIHSSNLLLATEFFLV